MRNVDRLQQPRTQHIEESSKGTARGILLRSIVRLEGKRKGSTRRRRRKRIIMRISCETWKASEI
jgi:hypothetical protein